MKVRVGRVDDLPVGRGLLVRAGGKSVAVFRLEDEFLAVDDTCPHRGNSLHEGLIHDGVVSCPWHGWEFDLRTGECPKNPLSRIATYPVGVEGCEIYIDV